ncbi:uncharacterized protein LOC111063919 [Nilaparvata lugens]|uniref:uncharacterized protein LOC111063919 n=1 Tax=Nilaparvata lugens TaxID=108931 RepID=UPI00193EBD3B|nr:uncharacterized protein LOC111063919 [Nilaparvata lugens]
MATAALLVGIFLLATVGAQDWNFPEEIPDMEENLPGGERPVRRPEPQQQQQQQQQQRPTQPPSTISPMDLDPANPGTVIFTSPCSGCRVTQQYNPVCGSDNRTYANKLVLDCHRVCGFDVTMKRIS